MLIDNYVEYLPAEFHKKIFGKFLLFVYVFDYTKDTLKL